MTSKYDRQAIRCKDKIFKHHLFYILQVATYEAIEANDFVKIFAPVKMFASGIASVKSLNKMSVGCIKILLSGSKAKQWCFND